MKMSRRRFSMESLEKRIVLDAMGPTAPQELPALESVIVALNDNVRKAGVVTQGFMSAYGGQLDLVYESAFQGFAARLPASGVDALRLSPWVKLIEPDLEMHTFAQIIPSGIDRIDVDKNAIAKIDGVDGTDQRVNVDIAIIDTGIYLHSDLNVVGGYNATGGSTSNWGDGHGHGTHVAGIAAALDNGSGVVGVAPGARLWAVKVLGDNGFGSLSNIIKGIDWVTANANVIDVANMSLGGQGVSAIYRQAIQRSVGAGVVYVVAAGNEFRDILGGDPATARPDDGTADSIPAAYPEVATISAFADSDGKPGGLGPAGGGYADDTFADFSNFSNSGANGQSWYNANNKVSNPQGLGIDLVLPGVNIYSTYKGGGYATMSGTSMASPHGAGLAALYIAANGRDVNGDSTVNQDDVYAIRQALIDGGKAWRDPNYGLKFTLPGNSDSPDNHEENLGWAGPSGPVDLLPSVNIIDPANNSTVFGNVTIKASAIDDHGVEQVEFFVNGGSIGADSDSSNGWSASLDTTVLADGSHDVTATATDTIGQTASHTISVTVDNIPDPPSDVVLFADSFENGPSSNSNNWNGKWIEDSQNDFFRSTQRSTDGARSAEVDGFASDATLTMFPTIDVSGYSSAELTFDWLIESGFDAGEFLALDILNSSSTWVENVRILNGLNGANNVENVWHSETVSLIPFGSANPKIRFRSTVSDSSEDANIDNVKIIASGFSSAGLRSLPPILQQPKQSDSALTAQPLEFLSPIARSLVTSQQSMPTGIETPLAQQQSLTASATDAAFAEEDLLTALAVDLLLV